MPLTELTSVLGHQRAAHFLRRATFGPTKDDIDHYALLTPAAAVNELYNVVLPEPELPRDALTGQEWVVTGVTDANSGDSDLQEFFKGWWIGQMMSTGIDANVSLSYSAREKVVFFIHTVLTTIQSKVDNSRSLYFQNALFRKFAFDGARAPEFNFRELTKKVSVDNAMLKVLDGDLNVKGSPNENYARELHELFTIGRGLEGTLPPVTEPGDYFLYKELDIQEAARVLSGWDIDTTFTNIDPDTMLPRGKVRGSKQNASSHDNAPKQFSDRFDGIVIQPDPLLLNGSNATEESAFDEVSQLIDSIYSRPETAKNICRRIYRHFVYHNITPAIDAAVITQMAATFNANQFKIQPVLRELFTSEHFYEAAGGVLDDNFGGIVKSPLDLQIATLRFFEVQLPDFTSSYTAFYEKTGALIKDLTAMGLHFLDPFDVAGYDAYHQYPIYHRAWISTNYLTNRYAFIRKLVSESEGMPGSLAIDPVNFVRLHIDNATASDAHELITALARYLLPLSEQLTFDTGSDDNAGITAERLNYFLNAFLYSPKIDLDPEGSWAFRWNNPVDPETVQHQLEGLFNAMMQSPEYQLC